MNTPVRSGVAATISGRIDRLKRWIGRDPTAFAASFDSYSAAARDCIGYEDPEIARVVRERTRALISFTGGARKLSRQAAQDLFVLSQVSRDGPLRVVELGGACGALFHLARIHQVGRVLDWTIVESQAMVHAASSLPRFPGLRFQHDFPQQPFGARAPDLVIASGALQYMPDPLATLQALLGFGPTMLYLTRTSVATDLDRPVVTHQVTRLAAHGPGPVPSDFSDRLTTQPVTFIPERQLLDRIRLSGFEVSVEFDEGATTPMRAGHQSFHSRQLGLLLARSRSAHDRIPGDPV